MNLRTLIRAAFLLPISFGCATSAPPPRYPVWVAWEGRAPTFARDRDSIQGNCDLIRKEESSGEIRTIPELHASAEGVGANAVVVEHIADGQQDRTTFFHCRSLPTSVTHGVVPPAHR